MLGEQERRDEHHQVTDSPQCDREPKRRGEQHKADDEAEDRPLRALGRIEAVGALIDASDELLVVLSKRLFHLLEDSLLILGKWHGSPPSRPLGTSFCTFVDDSPPTTPRPTAAGKIFA
jgi:hypothetical protein